MKKHNLLSSLAIVSVTILTKPIFAQDFINIPCPSYHKGDVFKFTSRGNGINMQTQTVVESVTHGTIQLHSKSNTLGQRTDNTQVLSKKGTNIYRVKTIIDAGGFKATNTLNPPEPICGKIPTTYSFVTKVSGPTGTAPMKTTVLLKKIGDKLLNSPLGNLKTTVVQKESTMAYSMPNAVKTNSASVSYYALKYGVVKRVITMKTMMPDYSSLLGNPATENFFANKMGDLTGSNIEDKLKQLEEIDRNAPTYQMKSKEVKNTITFELISHQQNR